MADAHQQTLEATLRDIAQQKGYVGYKLEVAPVSTGGANYTSQLFRGRITAPGKEEIKFFAKVAALGAKIRSQMPSSIFFTEQYAYSRLAGIFKKIQDKHKIASEHRLILPDMYGYSDEEIKEVLVLQDLGAEGFVVHDRFQSFDWQYASAAVQQIARLHALSIAMQHDYPEDYKEVASAIKFQQDAQAMLPIIQQAIDRFIEDIEDEKKERLRSYLAASLPKAMASYYDQHPRPVLNHGDFRTSNIMHTQRENGEIDLILLDYQTLHMSNAIKDLMYFIFLGSDAEFRRKHYQQLVDHYYQQLSLALTRLDLDPEKVFPRDDFDSDLKENLHFGLLYAVFTLPVVTVAEADAPPPGEQMAVENIMHLEASQLCRRRLDEIIDDYIAWGLL